MTRGIASSADLESKTLREFPPGRNYLIGVSGGRDSVALLHWLLMRGYKNLVVCHLNHQLRGRFSSADARFVEKLAAQCDVDLELGSTDVRAIAGKKKMSVETAGRSARYSFFAKVAKRRRCRAIFLAHHADDLVETFLMNLFRGAGTPGLASMREVSRRRIDGVDLTIIRPFLGIWRKDIDAYVRAHHLKFREDASNRDLASLRNRMRHRVIPYIEKQFGREIRSGIWRAAMITAEEENFFEELMPRGLTELAVKEMRAMPVTMQRRTLREWLHSHDVPDVSFELIERVRALLDLVSGVAKTNLPRSRHARRRAGRIFIE
jgi:tRNA(Ile)-lysidine synthase